MFIARDVAGCVDYVDAACFAFPAACLVESLLVGTCELGGVGQTGYGGGCHGSLCSQKKMRLMVMIIYHIIYYDFVRIM